MPSFRQRRVAPKLDPQIDEMSLAEAAATVEPADEPHDAPPPHEVGGSAADEEPSSRVSFEDKRRSKLRRASTVPELAAAPLASPSPPLQRPTVREPRNKKKQQRVTMFEARHGEERAKELREYTARVASTVERERRRSRFVLHPAKNKYLRYWDVVTSFALLYTATLTPFEAAFVQPSIDPNVWQDPWFVINRILDVIFIFDMVIQLFVAYTEEDNLGASVWVLDQNKIVRHYLTTPGLFAFDLLTAAAPLGFDIYIANVKASNGGNFVSNTALSADRLTILRTLRVVRLIKLVRLLRGTKVFERWKSRLNLSFGAETVLKAIVLLLTGIHLYSCVITLQASLHADVSNTWVGLYALCGSGPVVVDPTAPLPGCPELSTGSLYLAAFTWSSLAITGTGATDFYPSATSDAETAIVASLVLFGAFVWTIILASFCDITTNSNPANTLFRQRLDGLNMYISINRIPSEMAERMRRFLHQQRGVQVREDAKLALPHLSSALQIEVMLYVNSHWLESIWFVRELDDNLKVRLSLMMRPKVVGPGDLAPSGHMYVLSRGSVMFGGRISPAASGGATT